MKRVERIRQPGHALPRLLGLGGLLGYVAVMAWLLQLPYDVAGGVVIAHVLALITVPLLLWLDRDEEDLRLRRLVWWALGAKLLGTLLRYGVLLGVYGEGDALQYDEVGSHLSEFFRQGDFTVDVGKVVGTGFVEILTGVVYTLTGSTRLGGFLVFSWLGFWGLYLFYRAFRLACPDGEARRYGLLLFFLPSMLFWPSSIGKDAWMVLCLGAFAYGTARLISHRRPSLPWILAGTLGSAMVRPHVTVVAVASLIVAYLVTGTRAKSYASPLAKMAGIVVLVVVLAYAISAVESFFGLDEGTSIETALDRTQERTSKGGSAFDATGARSPVTLPYAIFSVIFRPLPYEASNPQMLLASLEGAFLLVVFVRHRRRLANLIPRRRSPYLAFAATYSVLFAVAFSNIANFGILARQRAQLFPFLIALLAVPRTRQRQTELATPAELDGSEPARFAPGSSPGHASVKPGRP